MPGGGARIVHGGISFAPRAGVRRAWSGWVGAAGSARGSTERGRVPRGEGDALPLRTWRSTVESRLVSGVRSASSELRFPGKKPLFCPEGGGKLGRGEAAASCPCPRGALLGARRARAPSAFLNLVSFGLGQSYYFAWEQNGLGRGRGRNGRQSTGGGRERQKQSSPAFSLKSERGKCIWWKRTALRSLSCEEWHPTPKF